MQLLLSVTTDTLDKIVNQVYDVALGSVKKYVGNYSKFLKERDAHYEKVMAEYERQQSEIKKLETFVEKILHVLQQVAWQKVVVKY